MSNKQQQDACKTMEQITTTAINNLINKTSTKFDCIKRAMDSLPADKKVRCGCVVGEDPKPSRTDNKEQGRGERRQDDRKQSDCKTLLSI
ncbi:MAG: hypothetical protein ACKPKO_58910 [Candidatus Fonsibacter sp.]